MNIGILGPGAIGGLLRLIRENKKQSFLFWN